MRPASFLTRDEEYSLALRWREEGHVPSMHRLVECYMPLARKMARKHRRPSIPDEDLVQEGIAGLIRAADTFDPAMGFRFGTYARWWVSAAIQEGVLRAVSVVAPGRSATNKSAFFRGEKFVPVLSLDVHPHDGLSLAETLECPAIRPDEACETALDGERRSKALHAAMSRLTARERAIIRGRFLQDEPATLEELGRIHRVSKERIRQIEAKALAAMRKRLVREAV